MTKNIKHPTIYPKIFIVDDKEITCINIVEVLNTFFTNIAPDLANSIPIQDANMNDFLNEPTVNSMFVKEITENEVNEIVSQFQSRTSTDNTNFSMAFVK